MRQLKFHHVFVALMVVSFVVAFVFPSRTTPLRPQLQGLFSPVARPAGAVGAWVRDRFDRPAATDGRPDGDVKAENDALRVALANLSEQLSLLKVLNADRGLLGHARALCTPVKVVGGDAATGARETLALGGSVPGGAEVDQPVLYPEGIAGRISTTGVAGTQVRLITDKDFRLTGSFCRYERGATGDLRLVKIATPPPLLVGVGRNAMVVANLPRKAVDDARIVIGDWVTLDDPTWPETLKGYRVGKVVSIDPLEGNALFAKIRVEPQGALARLREVMVMNRTTLAAAERAKAE